MIELFDKNVLRILTVFSISPGSRLNRKVLKEKTMLPNIVLDKTISRLLNFKILAREKNLFALNFRNGEVKKIVEIIAENYSKLKQLPLKEYFIIIDICEELSKIKGMEEIYLFGSYAKLVFTENSDIDLAIVSDSANKRDAERAIKKLEKKYKKAIEVHYFSKKFHSNKKDPLVKEILQHGVKLF